MGWVTAIKKASLKDHYKSFLKWLWSLDIRITALTRRIIIFNVLGLFVLICVMVTVYLPRFKEQMIEQRIEFLAEHGNLISLIIAEAAGRTRNDGVISYDPLAANQVLRRIVNDIGGRAQLYDKTGRLTADTRNIFGIIEPIEAIPLSEIAEDNQLKTFFEEISKRLEAYFSKTYPLYKETNSAGITDNPDIYTALDGEFVSSIRQNSTENLIVSVAIPVQKFKAVIGVLVLSTDSGDIDRVVSETRSRILELFSIILLVSILVSIIVSYTIAYPITRLTRATQNSSFDDTSNASTQRIHIPDMQDRGDEIGELSASLRAMTKAFYSRIDVIESFAADVAHEIKNPLTSLRSAVESLRIVRKDEDKERLMSVIEQDVMRMDRLLTDISNASRLDAELVKEQARSFDLSVLLDGIVKAMQKPGGDQIYSLELHARPVYIDGLENRLAQVFQNIIDNSLSFLSDNKEPKIDIRTESLNDHVLISISDNGLGIPEDSLKLIFQRFYTSRPQNEDFGHHSGLGLSICEQIVKAHSGEIWAENLKPPQQGAKFCILIPVRQKKTIL